MPMDRQLYPAEWDDIARQVKREAGWHCENCQRPCLLPNEDWLDFICRLGWTVADARSARPGQYKLTVAHLDHIPQNSTRSNLRAWCAPCHCRYDLQQMPLKKSLKRERNGQLRLNLNGRRL